MATPVSFDGGTYLSRLADFDDPTVQPPVPAFWEGGYRGAQCMFDEDNPASSGGLFDPEVLDIAEAAGVLPAFVRMNFIRPHVETAPGVWDFSRYNTYLDKMAAKGVRLFVTGFDGANGATEYPNDAAKRANWAAFAAAALQYCEARQPGLAAVWETWNEPDGSWPIPPQDYALLAQAVYEAIRAVPALDHIATAGPATAFNTTTYAQAAITGNGSSGVLDWVDIYTHHLYRAPEQLAIEVDTLRDKFAAYGVPDFPILIGEYNYDSEDGPDGIAKRLTVARAENLFGMSYFVLRDYSLFPDAGLIDEAGALKPAGQVWKTWHEMIGEGATFVSRDTLNTTCHSYKFTVGGQVVRCAWATTNTDIIVTGTYTAKDHLGAAIAAPGSHTLGADAIYLIGDVSVAIDPGSGADIFLTDVVSDFSLVQGQAGWTYHAIGADGTVHDASVQAGDNKWTAVGVADTSFFAIHPGQQHPGVQVKAMRRWTVPAGVTRVKVDGFFAHPANAGGDGTFCAMLHNGTERFRRTIVKNQSVPYVQVFNVAAGDRIEFVVGSGGTNINFDATLLDATFFSTTEAVNEPDVSGGAGGGGGGTVGNRVVLVFGSDGIVRWEAAP